MLEDFLQEDLFLVGLYVAWPFLLVYLHLLNCFDFGGIFVLSSSLFSSLYTLSFLDKVFIFYLFFVEVFLCLYNSLIFQLCFGHLQSEFLTIL